MGLDAKRLGEKDKTRHGVAHVLYHDKASSQVSRDIPRSRRALNSDVCCLPEAHANVRYK